MTWTLGGHMISKLRHPAFTLATVSALVFPLPDASFAQSDDDADGLEEVTVVARKREELLKDVPVAISVMSRGEIRDAGIESQFDLFEMTPGITFDQVQDRQASRPSVRGVQSQAQNPVRQKVTSFIDGVPVLGQTGSLQFVGVDQVTILRGPQSAAFGRATFAGAIDYTTSNPGETWGGIVELQSSDLGRNRASFSVGGPITENLGIIFDGNFDEFDGPDEWISSDGVELGGTQTDYYSTALVFDWGEASSIKFRYTHLETDDEPQIEYFIDGAAQASCSNLTLPNGELYIDGEFNCSLPNLSGNPVPLNHQPELDFTPGTSEFFLVQSYSVLDPASRVERDRFQLNADFGLSNGSAIQILASSSQDDLRRWFDADGSDAMAVVANMMGMLSVTGVNSMANPNEIEESYAEVRWVSPADNDLRMVFGASVFDYDSLTNIFNQYAGVLLGLEDEVNNGQPFSPINILSDSSTNSGIFANLTYDISDRTTAAVELRYQEDDITNVNNTTGESFSNVTESWQPRLSVNHQLNDEWSVYGQASSGTNAAGVNIPFTLDDVRGSLAAAAAAGAVQFDDTTFLNFDEERITSYEIGVKGATSDRRLRLAASLYVMDWEDMVQPLNLQWNGAWNDGSFDPNGTVYNMAFTMARTFLNTGDGDLWGVEVEANWAATENLSIRGAFTYAQAEFASNCDPLAVTNLGLPPTDTIADGAATNCVDVAGNDIPGQPDVTGALTGTYAGNIGGGWDWLGRLDLRYQSSEYIDAVNLAELPAFTQVNASVAFRNEMFDIRLFVNNLTDEDTPQTLRFIADNNQVGSPDNFAIRPRNPREVGLRVNVGFGDR